MVQENEKSFRCSSAVEQLTVNQLAAGSNPAAGASDINPPLGGFCLLGSERRM